MESDRALLERIRQHYAFLGKLASHRVIAYEGKRVSLSSVVQEECLKAMRQIEDHLNV